MRRSLLLLALSGSCLVANAQDQVTYDTAIGHESVATSALYSPGKADASATKTPAVVLIHSSGGFKDRTTAPLARALNAAGFATLELQLFDRAAARPSPDKEAARIFGALGFLGTRAEIDSSRIGVAGFSYGAHFTLWTATQWMAQTYGKGARFAAHAAAYPVCWMHTGMAKGSPPPGYAATLPFPKDFFTAFTSAPVKVFAAGKDDYDDRDPNACKEMLEAIPAAYRAAFELVTYPDATHGWNQRSQSFYEAVACKGRGCMNRNVNNPEVTQRSTDEIVQFFKDKLGASR